MLNGDIIDISMNSSDTRYSADLADMPGFKHTSTLRSRVAGSVRELRQERGWTQAQLADKLGLSQNRLSEIERGGGSFTAEQFLLILKLFNVPTSRFTGVAVDRDLQLQNALARLGASHLRESSEVPPADDLVQPYAVVREAILKGEPRLITALSPVLIHHADVLDLSRLFLDLQQVGRERRLPWVCQNTLWVLDSDVLDKAPRDWVQRANRAAVVIGAFILNVSARFDEQRVRGLPPDAVDPNIRSQKTLEEVSAASSTISRQWGIVSALQPRDFAQAIRAARAART
jgi:transcriptional regulator with XRE-family HTH domain